MLPQPAPSVAITRVDVRPPRRALDDAPVDEVREIDEVHEAALDSFPASDAPSWSPLRVGSPAPRERPAAAPAGS